MQTNPIISNQDKPRSSKRIKKLPGRIWWIVLAGVVIAAGAVAYFTIHAQQANAASSAQQPALQTAVARQGNLILRASGTGTLIAAQQVNLNFKSSGVLKALNVKVGDQVKAGDLLAQLDDFKSANCPCPGATIPKPIDLTFCHRLRPTGGHHCRRKCDHCPSRVEQPPKLE